MGFTWNEAQQKVIDFRGSNLLVSAAAGSGKTAVLTEHVARRVLDEDNGCDINELLIMTFTNAAAAEMKERIRTKLSESLLGETDPSRCMRIRRELSLLNVANISTMHSFCYQLIKEYFYKVSLAPGCSIGDATELKLMLSDVTETIVDEWFLLSKNDTDAKAAIFRDLAYLYGEDGKKSLIAELIMIYEHSRTHADPAKWLSEVLSHYEEPEKSYEILIKEAERTFSILPSMLSKTKQMAIELYDVLISEDIKETAKLIKAHINFLEEVESEEDFSEKIILLKEKPLAKERIKKTEFKEKAILDTEFTKRRNEYVDPFRKFVEKIDLPSLEEYTQEQKRQYPIIACIIEIISDIEKRYTEQKRKKRLLDYNDLEHLALSLLEISEVRRDFQSRYKEILVDEYQDSSEVQNTLLNYLNVPDKLFMVGDVKQSIYAFRQAKPQYFMEKYDAYRQDNFPDGTCICLNQNYRSRRKVLDAINGIFTQIMQKTRGGIEYDEDNALHVGKEDVTLLEDEKENIKPLTVHRIIKDAEAFKGLSGRTITEKELEACVIGDNILKLVKNNHWDDVSHTPVRYRDIVILARSVKSLSGDFMHVLQDLYGIPCVVTVGSAYFDTLEINTLLSILQIIDNPRQDIPLVTTLTAKSFSFTSSELAKIRAFAINHMPGGKKPDCFYSCLCVYDDEKELTEKIHAFLEVLDDFRTRSMYFSLPELLEYIMHKTDYRELAASLPGGRGRIINIDMLVQKAKDFEKTNYSGTYQFLRYVDKLKEREIEMETPSTLSENDDVVRIMTIHKSKGLEFPIVFLMNATKKLAHSDTTRKIHVHPSLGLVFDHPVSQMRMKIKSTYLGLVKRITQNEDIYEELRVLYVALTRAKGYLHVSGIEDASDFMLIKQDERLSDAEFSEYGCYFDWIKASILRYLPDVMDDQEQEDLLGALKLYGMYTYDGLAYNERFKDMNNEKKREQKDPGMFELLAKMLRDPSWKDAYRDEIEDISRRFDKKYSFSALADQKAIVSVSALKHDAMEEFYENEEVLVKEHHPVELEDKSNAGPNKGALRGTAYHEILQRLTFSKIITQDADTMQIEKAILSQIDLLLAKGLITEEDVSFVTIKDLVAFFESDLAKRMARAEEKGKLYKEKRFMFGVSVAEYLSEYAVVKEKDLSVTAQTSGDLVLLRGIIDAFFEEDGSFVIMDYKTDHVTGPMAKNELIGRYKKQLDIYKKALVQMTGATVSECIIYSFCLHCEIKLS